MSYSWRNKDGEGGGEPGARRRSAPWFFGGLVLLLLSVLVALQVFGLWDVVTPDTASDTLLLYALSSLNFAAFIVFTFIFVRSLLKLRRERRERQLGSKIKTRLVVYFIAVSLLPITAMAVFSYIFFNRSLEKWFSSLPEEVVREASEVQRNQMMAQDESLREAASTVALLVETQLPAPQVSTSAGSNTSAGSDASALPNSTAAPGSPTAPNSPAPLDSPAPLNPSTPPGSSTSLDAPATPGAQAGFDARAVAERLRLVLLAVIAPDGSMVVREETAALPDRQRDELHRALERASPRDFGAAVVRSDAGTFNFIAVPLADGGRRLVVARERVSDPSLAKLVAGAKTFEDFKRRQRRVRLLGLSTLGLLTLMLLFAATWSAIHLARGIATPIRALAEASDEVAKGNLEYRVTAIADDELALLAASFNQMTAQLEENRRRIEASATQLREKNLALAERRDYIETILESLSTGVVSLDREDRVTTINAASLSMLRLESAPATGTKLADIIGASDMALLASMLRRARLRGRAAGQMELARSSAPDGGEERTAGAAEEKTNGGAGNGGGSVGGSNSSVGAGNSNAGSSGERVIPVAVTAIALGSPTDEGRGVVLVIEDLSDLLAAQRAAAWSEVARRMAHEIKNPLTPIQLSAERIARNFRRFTGKTENAQASMPHAGETSLHGAAQGTHGDASSILDLRGARAETDAAEGERVSRLVEECTATITREVAGLKAMVDEFSRFARLPHARLESADLNEVVRQALTLYQDRLEGVRLDVGLAKSLPAAMLDAEQLRRVFVNLIDNALEALNDAPGDERRVTVATGHDPARGLLLAEVADNGHGIAHKDFPRLFQPYFSTRGRGTGLGLAIVQRIINEHGGRIRAEANRPRGARFILELPVAEETKTSDERGGASDERKIQTASHPTSQRAVESSSD